MRGDSHWEHKNAFVLFILFCENKNLSSDWAHGEHLITIYSGVTLTVMSQSKTDPLRARLFGGLESILTWQEPLSFYCTSFNNSYRT